MWPVLVLQGLAHGGALVTVRIWRDFLFPLLLCVICAYSEVLTEKMTFTLEFERRLGLLHSTKGWKGIPGRRNNTCRGRKASRCWEGGGCLGQLCAAGGQSGCQGRGVDLAWEMWIRWRGENLQMHFHLPISTEIHKNHFIKIGRTLLQVEIFLGMPWHWVPCTGSWENTINCSMTGKAT